MKCPSAAEIAERFVKFGPGRSDRFEEGVRNPDGDWEKNTKEAEPNYEEGVRKGISRKAFGKGVAKCGTAKQQEHTIRNIPRWSEGISAAGPDMAAAMAPVVAVIQATTLPQRYPKGDERNYERVKVIGKALRKAKEEGKF